MKLIIASGNAGKLREIRAILGGKFDEILSMMDAGAFIPYQKHLLCLFFDMKESYGALL